MFLKRLQWQSKKKVYKTLTVWAQLVICILYRKEYRKYSKILSDNLWVAGLDGDFPSLFIFCFICPDFYNSGYKQALWSQKDLRFALDFGRSSGLYLLIYHEGTLPISTPLRNVKMTRSHLAQWWVNKCSKMLASVMIRRKVLFFFMF